MGKRHFDNKNDLLATLKANKRKQTYDSAAAFSANMLMSLYTLRKEFGFGQQRIEKFINAMGQLNQDIESGDIDMEKIQDVLLDEIGVIVELPK